MEALEALQQCTTEGNVVKLPPVQLDRDVYLELKKKLELIGGKWKGGKVQGFVFAEDPGGMLEELAAGGDRNLKKEFQFFGTPDDLGDYILELADIPPSSKDWMPKVLEPSAGQGALIKAMWRAGRDPLVWACELMPLNKKILSDLSDDINVFADDFLKIDLHEWGNTFDRVIANPPFTKNQDIDHIMQMYKVCKPGGRIVSMASNSWRRGSQKKQVIFKEWLWTLEHNIIDVEAGRFKESGTTVASCIVVIDKES